MATHALPHTSRLHRARKWMRVHIRRHVPFALYTAITTALMLWMSLIMLSISR